MRYLAMVCFSAFCWMSAGLPAAGGGAEGAPARLMARIPEICRDVEAIRGLKFLREVPIELQTSAEFLEYVNEAINKQFAHTDEEGFMKKDHEIRNYS